MALGLFGNKDKTYDNELILLNKKYDEVSAGIDKCNNDNVALGMAFDNYKQELANDKTSILSQIGDIWEFVHNLNADIIKFNQWKEEQDKEIEATQKAKDVMPDNLTYKEVCKSLKEFRYLSTASFKYFLYECGILDMKINQIHNTYRLSENFSTSNAEVKKYIHTTNGVVTFDKNILEYFMENSNELQASIDRYVKKQKQFNESKERISMKRVKNYQAEIGKICGIDDGNGKKYNVDNWEILYKRYGVDHKDWLEKYYLWKPQYLSEHPELKYATRLTYIVKECGDGDVLLKIACELFVN